MADLTEAQREAVQAKTLELKRIGLKKRMGRRQFNRFLERELRKWQRESRC